MKPIFPIVMLTILGMARLSHAQTDLGDNAALRYYQAFVSLLGQSHEEHRDTVRAIRSAEGWIDPTPEVRAALEAHALTLKFMSQGAAIDTCDFGVDYSEGHETLVVGVTDLNAGARLLLADACRAFEDGVTAAADERIAQSIRVSRHLWRFAGTLGPIVGCALTEPISQITTEALERGLVQPDQLVKTADALAFLDRRDPFAVRSVIEHDRAITHALIKSALNDPGGDTAAELDRVIQEMMRAIATIEGSDKAPDPKLFDRLLSENPEESRDELREMLADYDRFANETLATLDTETPCESAEDLRSRAKEYGLLTQVFGDILPQVVYHSHHASERLRELADRLGVQPKTAPVPANEQVNAALVYWPAFGFILKEDRARLDLIKDPAQVVQVSDDLRAFLSDHEQTIQLLLRGAAMDHCDFGNREATFDTLQSHVGFSRSAARLLVCDAVRLFRNGEAELGEHRLLAALDVASDCAQTHNSIETIIHAAGIAFTVDVVGRCLDEKIVEPGDLESFHDKLNAFDDEDPFQIRECIAVEKRIARRSIEQAFARSDSGPEFAAEFNAMIADDPDEIDPMARAMFSHDNWKVVVSDALRGMDRYFDDVGAALETENPVASIRELQGRILSYGVFAGIFAPAFDRMYQECEKVNTEIHELLHHLEDAPDPR